METSSINSDNKVLLDFAQEITAIYRAIHRLKMGKANNGRLVSDETRIAISKVSDAVLSLRDAADRDLGRAIRTEKTNKC